MNDKSRIDGGRELLKELLKNGSLSPLSYYFSRFIARQANCSPHGIVAVTAAAVAERNQQGDVCIELQRCAGKPLFASSQTATNAEVMGPAAAQWQAELQSNSCVGGPKDVAPLILDSGRLYLHRFWHYEEAVREAIMERLASADPIDEMSLRAGLDRLFPAGETDSQESPAAVDWQKLASALAVSRRFAVISGGPGTGKTTTVIKVLALLLEQNPDMHIRLTAPTGKAAARMIESIRSRKDSVAIDEKIKALIPDRASTLHRLLGYTGTSFRHDRHNPLVADCLVIDEASMIDLTLMKRLLDAVPVQARIILLGDRDQLASVDAGNVLGDITGHGQDIAYSRELAARLSRFTGIAAEQIPVNDNMPAVADSIALLRTSFRFSAASGIGRLAALVNAGRGEEALGLLRSGDTEAAWLEGSGSGQTAEVVDWAVRHYSPYLDCSSVEEALALFERSRILCAVHRGPLGDEQINVSIAARLHATGTVPAGDDFHGKPVMVTVNDYEVDLYNGDIGLLWRNPQGDLRACFKLASGDIRDIPARSLPAHVSAWAMSVHKSQGSEFDHVLLVLPTETGSPVLSKELIYTGITRAKQKVVVQSSASAFVAGCNTHVQRSSGLAGKLGYEN